MNLFLVEKSDDHDNRCDENDREYFPKQLVGSHRIISIDRRVGDCGMTPYNPFFSVWYANATVFFVRGLR